jgi:hypothetical protein
VRYKNPTPSPQVRSLDMILDIASNKKYLVHVKIEEVNKPKLIILLVAVVVNAPAIFIVP